MLSVCDYSKSLAALLSNEQLSIEFDPSIAFAAMDTTDRVIKLNPFILEFNKPNAMERVLVHEVGHALYSNTPENSKQTVELISKFGKEMFNIVEDIRIENLLKSKFKGLGTLFTKGFYELDNLLKDKVGSSVWDIDKETNIFDRVNSFFKSNETHPIFFSEIEQAVIDELKVLTDVSQMESCISKLLSLGVKSDNDVDTPSTESFLEVSGVLEDTLFQKQEDELNNLKSEFRGIGKRVYVLSSTDISPPPILAVDAFTKICRTLPVIIAEKNNPVIVDLINKCDHRSTILQTEFTRKQNAYQFRHIQKNKTGYLDLSRLSHYKTSSRLFGIESLKPRLKNHEIVILLDWSVSIDRMLVNLVVEAISFVKFCRKVAIPCSVYSFSSDHETFKLAKGVEFSEEFGSVLSWVQVLSTSTVNFDESCKNLLAVALNRGYGSIPLSSTPLLESIWKIPEILVNSIANRKRTSLVIISDGESDMIRFGSGQYTVLDPLTHERIPLDMGQNEFVFKRLKKLFPTLSILTLHVGSGIEDCIYRNRFLSYDVIKRKLSEIKDKLNQTNMFCLDLEFYNHITVRIPSYDYLCRDQSTKGKSTVQMTKKEAKKILDPDNSGLAKLLYQNIVKTIA